MTGWIKVHRKITENPLWSDTPFSKGQAWIDLIIMANRNPATLVYGNTIIPLERGQLHTSELKLMQRWGWSKKKVRSYLVLLKTLQMATVEGTAKGTTITIENYSVYQDLGTAQDTNEDTAKEPRRNREGTAKDTQTRSKESKERKEDIYSKIHSELHGPLKKYAEMRKGMKKPMSDRAVELLISKLNKLSGGNSQLQIEMLEEATLKNWLSVYLPKESNPTEAEKQAAAERKRQADQEAEAIIEKERQEMQGRKSEGPASLSYDFLKKVPEE